MPIRTLPLTTTDVGNGTKLPFTITATSKQARFLFTGTFAGLVGYLEASYTGNDTDYVQITGVREDYGTGFTGVIGAANTGVVCNVGGYSYVRFRPVALGSGTVNVGLDYGAGFDLPLGITPISLNYVAQAITSSSANALSVGPNGTTNPAFNIDASAASAATGWGIAAAAATGGAALSVISSGANESGTIDAKGTGTLTLQGTATGAITLARNTGVTGTATVTSAGAAALSVGVNGATNPALVVDASTASSATGLRVKSAAAAAGVALAAVSSGTNENLTLDAKGSGTVTVGGTSTGAVRLGAGAAAVQIPGTLTAGGLLTCALQVATSGPLVYSGSGAPTINAAVQGSIYLRTDGSSTSTRLYVATNTSGTWTPCTTAA